MFHFAAGGWARASNGWPRQGACIWHGRPLVAWLHRITRPLTDDLLISCNRNLPQYRAFADRLVQDAETDFPGPLAGIRAGLAVARHPTVMVLPCDAPLIDEALLAALYTKSREQPDLPLMARRGSQWEPLFCIIPVSVAPAIEEAWRKGERSNRRILASLEARALELDIDDPRTANMNSPELLLEQPPPKGT